MKAKKVRKAAGRPGVSGRLDTVRQGRRLGPRFPYTPAEVIQHFQQEKHCLMCAGEVLALM